MTWQDQMYQNITPGAQTQLPSELPWQNQLGYQQPSYTPQGGYGGSNDGHVMSSLLQFIPGLMSNFKGQDIKPQQQSTGQLGQITNAMTNTANPLYQQLYGQNRQSMMQDLGQDTASLEGRNRSLSAMGRTPLFAPGRGGETAFRNMTQGYENAGQQAATQTMGQLAAAGNMTGNLMNAQNNVSALQTQNKNSKLTGYENLAMALKLFGM